MIGTRELKQILVVRNPPLLQIVSRGDDFWAAQPRSCTIQNIASITSIDFCQLCTSLSRFMQCWLHQTWNRTCLGNMRSSDIFAFFSTPSDRSYDLDRSPARLARFISRFSWAATCWATTVGLGFRTPPAVPMPLVLERFKARNYGSPEGPPRVLWARPMLWKLSKQFRYRLDFLQTPQVSTISFDFKSLF